MNRLPSEERIATRGRQFREAELRSRVHTGIKEVIGEARAASSGDLSSAQLRERPANRKAALEGVSSGRTSSLRGEPDAVGPTNVIEPEKFEMRRAAIHERESRIAERSRDDENDLNESVKRARLNEDPA